jgi:hypothetical protein
MLVSEMTVADLWGLLMLFALVIFIVALMFRHMPEGSYGNFLKYAASAGLVLLPALYWGWPVFTAG